MSTPYCPDPWTIGRLTRFHGNDGMTMPLRAITDDHPLFPHEIALVWAVNDDEDVYNARLIAAAPDLLRAGCDLLAAMDAEPQSAFGTDVTTELAVLRAAIAKATQDQPA